jgi:phage baseplate assembly protein W
MDNTKNSFIGTGWTFPPSFSNKSGTVEMSTGTKDIEESLNILLSTTLGERVMQLKYGCNLKEYLFESLDSNMIGYIKQRVSDAILFYEPRITAEKIEVTPDDASELLEGKFTISVAYSIPGTNSRFNYVFDFYKNEALKPL